MPTRLPQWIGAILILALAGALAGCGSPGPSQEIGELRQQIQALEGRLQEAASAQELEALKAEVGRLTDQLAELAGPRRGTSLRIAFVNAEEVFVKYKGTEAAVQKYRQEKESKEAEIQRLRDQLAAGQISQNEFQTKFQELSTQLALLDQQLTNEITQKIVEVVEQLGAEKDYDLVTTRKNVVLYYKEGVIEDITDQVLERMNALLESESESESGSSP